MKRIERLRAQATQAETQRSSFMQEPASAKDPWQQTRGVVFGKVTVRSRNGNRSISRIDKYFEALVQQAAQGDLKAAKERMWVERYLENKELLSPPIPETPGRIAFRKSREKHQARQREMEPVFGWSLRLFAKN